MTRLAVWLAGQVSYERAAQILGDVGQMPISGSSVWRMVTYWGERLLELEAAERRKANATPGRGEDIPGQTPHKQRMGIAADGWMVNIRQEGWKEVKTGVVFAVERQVGYDESTGEEVERACAEACSYVAHLGGPEDFGEALWSEALHRQVPAAPELAFLGDGARWIWPLVLDYFPEAEQIVDWYHATQHLHAAARSLHGEGTAAAKQWVNAQTTTLYQGHADRLADRLHALAQDQPQHTAQALQTEAGYFENNKRRMRYLQYREDGWPIGSGMAEGGCKQFQQRMKGPGMRWSRPGADRMLALTATIMSNRFDQRWQALQNSPPN